MDHFPVTNSNLSAVHLGLYLQDCYGLSEQTKCKLIRAGINDTYLVNDCEQKFVFRVYSCGWRNFTEISEEIRLLNQLKIAGISVSYPLVDKESNYIQTLHAPEGGRYGVLFSYAYGEKLHNFSAATHSAIGGLMARFHSVTHNQILERETYTPEVLLVDSIIEIEAFLPADSEEMAMMRMMQEHVLEALHSANLSKIRTGVVHLDIWFDNLNVTNDGVVTIFDFDFCGNGWQCLDIAYYLMQLYVVEPIESEYRFKADAFLKGYETHTQISAEEKRLLPALGISLHFFYLGVQCKRFENFSNVFMSETYLKRYITHRVKKYFDFCVAVEN